MQREIGVRLMGVARWGEGSTCPELEKPVYPVSTFARKLERGRHNLHVQSLAHIICLSTSPELTEKEASLAISGNS